MLTLSWRERWLLAQSVALLPAMAVALRFVSPGRLLRFIERRGGSVRVVDRSRSDRIAHMVAAAAAYGPYRASCLPQSLVLLLLLRRHGLAGDLKFGVATSDLRLRAHCWVEINGKPLIDSAAVHQQFATLG